MHSRNYAPLYFVIFFVTHAVSSTNNASLENNAAEIEDNPLVEYLLQKWVIPKLEARLQNSQNDTNKLINDVNNIFGNTILSKNGESIQIDYKNLLSFIKLQGKNTLGKIIGTNDIILNILAQRKLSDSVDYYFSRFEGPITKANFPISIQTRRSQISSRRTLQTALVRGIFSSLFEQFVGPIRITINQALLDASTQLMKLYQPIVPTDFVPSILVTLLNEVITGVVNIIDNVKVQINTVLTPAVQPTARALYKRSASPEVGTNTTRSVLDVILSPLRFIAGLVLSPLHNILTSITSNLFVSLRPVVGGIILGPLESLILAIVNLIPCSTCV